MENNWQIVDENGVVYSGTEEEMDSAWDYMTMSLDSLYEYHEGEIERSDLQDGKNKWNKEWVGELRLIQIHKHFN